MIYFRAFWEEIKRGLEESWNYKMSFLSEIATIIILYGSLLFFNSGLSLAELYPSNNADSKILLLAGYMLWTFSIMAINTVSNTISYEAISGTLEHKFMSIIPMSLLNFANFVQAFIIQSLIVGVLLIISKMFFYINMSFNFNLLLVVLITCIGMYGIGLIFGGIALKEKRIGKIVYIFQILLLFVSDTITNISSNIPMMKVFPLTLGNDLLRENITLGAISLNKFCVLLLSSFAWLLVGGIVFKIFEKKTKREGILATY